MLFSTKDFYRVQLLRCGSDLLKMTTLLIFKRIQNFFENSSMKQCGCVLLIHSNQEEDSFFESIMIVVIHKNTGWLFKPDRCRD